MTFDPQLFQRSREPIYLQIAKLLRQRIEMREWKVGEQIPTLEALMAAYGVARSTLREAFAQLEQEGLIRRTRGSGTFVTRDLSSQRWFKLPMNWDEMLESVAHLHVRPLPTAPGADAAPPPVDFVAGGQPADAYQHMRRVHYREDVAYCLIDVYLASEIFERDRTGFVTAPVLARLAVLPSVQISEAKQVIWITVSDETTAACLGIGVGDPIAELRRALVDAQGRIIYYAHIRYPAQHIRLEIDLLALRQARGTACRKITSKTRSVRHQRARWEDIACRAEAAPRATQVILP
ncbi:MAG: GntR family transcriptional regulator [Proteobacteria bacterium]|nr:GntR family transcriptional regulator [Pseudomonadota bacterium]